MVEKNEKKEKDKKNRNLWVRSPVTRIVENKKAYKRFRDRKDKRIYEEELELMEGNNNETNS